MNYSWIAYENMLQELAKYIPPGHREYENVCRLQSSLRENIEQARHQNASPQLHTDRKQLIVELENIMKQASGTSFVETCTLTNPVFRYLIFIYQTAQNACKVFRSRRVWPSQCKEIIQQFGERPMLDTIIGAISGTSQSSLRYIDGNISNLVPLIKDFEKRCPRLRKPAKGLQKRQGEILNKLEFFVMEVRTLDRSSFEEIITLWQEIIGPARSPIASSTRSFSQQKRTLSSSSTKDSTEDKASFFHDQKEAATSKTQQEDSNQQTVSIQQQATEQIFSNGDPKIQRESNGYELNNSLKALLLKVPDIGNPVTRTSLLDGIPNRQSLPRDYNNALNDISGLVNSLVTVQRTDGKWALLILIENALSRLEDTMDGKQLKNLQHDIEIYLRSTT